MLFCCLFAAYRDGCIKAVGPVDAIRRQFSETSFEKIIDCSGKCVLPGSCIFLILVMQKRLADYVFR